jgi:hypothetical protein
MLKLENCGEFLSRSGTNGKSGYGFMLYTLMQNMAFNSQVLVSRSTSSLPVLNLPNPRGKLSSAANNRLLLKRLEQVRRQIRDGRR